MCFVVGGGVGVFVVVGEGQTCEKKPAIPLEQCFYLFVYIELSSSSWMSATLFDVPMPTDSFTAPGCGYPLFSADMLPLLSNLLTLTV